MSAAGTFGELERVVQAIALGEGFQLLVIECEGFTPGVLHRLLDEVQRQAAGLRGVPPLILTYDPYLTEDWVEDDVSPTVMRGLRERSSISAREIFERARAGGPEGLARLAEAIEIVTGQ